MCLSLSTCEREVYSPTPIVILFSWFILPFPFWNLFLKVFWIWCQTILGGPFLPRIEYILRDKALSMSSPVISASDPGNRSTIKGVNLLNGGLSQCCDIVIQIDNEVWLAHVFLNKYNFTPWTSTKSSLISLSMQFIELLDVNLRMLGPHQLQNAATATCVILTLRNLGIISFCIYDLIFVLSFRE